MSGNGDRIMEVVADDAPSNSSPEYVRKMLKYMRRFVNEHPSNPSETNFKDWSGRHSYERYKDHFGGWNNAVEAAGGEPNERSNHNWDEVEDKLEEKVEKVNRYGGEVVEVEGKLPPPWYLDEDEEVPGTKAILGFYGSWEKARSELGVIGTNNLDGDFSHYFES